MSKNVFSGTVSRRSFLKAGAFTAAVVALANGGYELRWPEEAFADQDSPEEVRYTYCDMCNQVPKCGIKATVKEGKIVRVEARKDGWPNTPICSKGLASLQELYDPHRLLYPMKRTNPTKSRDEDPGWERIGWDEAYDTIAQHMLDAKEKYGAESVMLYCGDPKEPRGAINRLANLFGTPTNSNESSCCMMAAQMGAAMVFGERSVGADPTETSKSCLIWSLNPAWSMAYRFGNLLRAKDNGTKFIVVDPRITPTVESLADIHLQPRPGTDGALALGIAHVMLRDGLYDAAFCEEWVLGFEEFRAYVQDFTPEKVEEITWVPADKIEAAAQMWGQETPGAFITSAAPTVHGSNAGNTQRAICSLVALAGNLDVTGGLPINAGLPFTAFADTMAFERVDLYGKGGLQAKRFDAEDFPVWAYFNKNMQANRFPEYIDEGKIKVMMMWGGNAMMWPQSDVYQKAIGKLEFSAAADYYIRRGRTISWTLCFLWPCATSAWRRSPSSAARSTCASPWCRPRERRARTTRSCSNWAVGWGWKRIASAAAWRRRSKTFCRRQDWALPCRICATIPRGTSSPPTASRRTASTRRAVYARTGSPASTRPVGKWNSSVKS